ncbi:putative peptidase family M28 family [Rosellinia necatrix]|uniref:Peptide hydrolase n=1 Tax=Rosellinia necatrix TaxID=77044 RepID=A0A1W2TAI7_ROSNE|nr:putative peptidase family M28 family [Rosellinia necatrix]
MALSNPFAFQPFSVSFWTTVTYLALLIPLIVHEAVPQPPGSAAVYHGLNLTKAWLDLTVLSRSYHPFNSRKNDEIHNWLLLELDEIRKRNGADESNMVVLEDVTSNITTSGSIWNPATKTGTYFEGKNIIVYVRGKDDPPGRWWEDGQPRYRADKVIGKGGVLLNAHYDSVSTGYGATDDGMGCITVMALVDYFSRSENQPQRGIVALLNNNEEDFLWGAQAFGSSPFMPFCHTFLNLEGAGAGGRATLFRATDVEVTAAYRRGPNPFGTVVASDAFSLGAIRSNTDYIVFNGVYGMRGLDMAFYRPRARYHTNEDDAKHASRASLWHMLSNSLYTVKALSGNTGKTFIGDRGDRDRNKIPNSRGNLGVWFDLFGTTLALFELRTFFAWSLTLLTATPLILVALTYLLVRQGKYYFFSSTVSSYEGAVLDPVTLGGRKGMLRFPFALGVAGALVVGSAYLVTKINPLIVYSSEYAVWAMMLSLFYFVFWTIMASANFARPSALHRGYSIIWIFTIVWVLGVVNTVFEDRFQIASGYTLVFFHASVFFAAVIALCELFALPSKMAFAQRVHAAHDAADHGEGHAAEHDDPAPHTDDPDDVRDDRGNDEPGSVASETTPLIGDTTFGAAYRRASAALDRRFTGHQGGAYGSEQLWSSKLPGWAWFPQFLVLGPFQIILVAQIGLFLVSSVSQTGSDGGSLLLPYLIMAILSIVLLLPITPYIHRVTHHVPMFLLAVFVGTLIYNLVAFPFSAANRYKLYFQQTVDLDTGFSKVHYVGLQEYVEKAVADLPSITGKELTCELGSSRAGLYDCFYDGSAVPPNVVKTRPPGVLPQRGYDKWLTFNITRNEGESKARFKVHGEETRSCAITFKKPISTFQVAGGASPDERFGGILDKSLEKIKLYRRDWSTPWVVDVEWEKSGSDDSGGIDGRVVCSWDDVNTPGAIPAFDEGIQFFPPWVAVSKLSTGLCEGSKAFKA